MKALLLAVMFAAASEPETPSRPVFSVSLKPVQASAARSGPVWVVITLKNVTASPVTITGVPAIILTDHTGASWWAPFDFGSQAHLGPNAVSTHVAAGTASSTVRVDLAVLRWAKSISSVWPSHALNVAVPSGQYSVRFKCEGQGNPTATLASSPASLSLQ